MLLILIYNELNTTQNAVIRKQHSQRNKNMSKWFILLITQHFAV